MGNTYNDIQTARPIRGEAIEVSGSASALNADLIPQMDVSDFQSIQLQIAGTFTGTITLQVSNDATTWVASNVVTPSSTTGGSVSTFTAAGQWYGVVTAKYMRLRMTSYTSGTATCVVMLGTNAAPMMNINGQVGVTLTASASTSNAVSTFTKINSAATTNATSIKASSGRLYHISLTNTSAALKYVKLYNKASAPTVGTDVPVMVFGLPATSTSNPNINSMGIAFTTGIALAITGGAADTDTTAVALNDVIVNILTV